MRIYIPNTSKQSIGGGWTFLRNIKKALSQDVFVSNWSDSDIILITGATMTSRDEMTQAKAAGKKIVFRVDNIPKDSRNRGTAFSRMLDFARMADFIVFQSNWAKDYAGWWFKNSGVDIDSKSSVVYNGVDPEFFYQEGEPSKGRYLYVQYNRDENKREREAFYDFHQAYRNNKSVELWLVGQFSPELTGYNFDFFAGEDVTYLGVVEDQAQLGDIYRRCEYILFPAYADAAPNTLLEAITCGCKAVGLNPVGGSIEMLGLKGRTIDDMGRDYKELFNKVLYGKI